MFAARYIPLWAAIIGALAQIIDAVIQKLI
jgi:hypothetical protein